MTVSNIEDSGWGGSWTEKKLVAFAKYVKAYLAIMSKCKYWKTIYFDGFAGSGDRSISHDNKDYKDIYRELFDSESIPAEEIVYHGSAERVVRLSKKFDYYYFIDADKDSIESLKTRLSPFVNGLTVCYKKDDANLQIIALSKMMLNNPGKYASLVFLDPFTMNVNWDSIKTLSGTRTDLWILVPTGVIINRLLQRDGTIGAPMKLVNFFGISENDIKKEFYEQSVEDNLFGNGVMSTRKLPNAIERIAGLYVKRLETVFKFVTKRPLVLYNSKNVPIFHLIFASNNFTAKKIASQIIKDKI
jgi:three-Cys-motif partner protein